MYADEPSFTVKPKDQIVEEQGTVSFNCDAIGNPAPQITWIKDGETVGNTSNLTFTAFRNNSGKYWCLAKNELAAAIEDSAFLDVHCKSSPMNVLEFNVLNYYDRLFSVRQRMNMIPQSPQR